MGTHLLRVAEREAVIHKHVKIHEQGEGGGVGWVVGVGWGGGGGGVRGWGGGRGGVLNSATLGKRRKTT